MLDQASSPSKASESVNHEPRCFVTVTSCNLNSLFFFESLLSLICNQCSSKQASGSNEEWAEFNCDLSDEVCRPHYSFEIVGKSMETVL